MSNNKNWTVNETVTVQKKFTKYWLQNEAELEIWSEVILKVETLHPFHSFSLQP